MILVGAIAVMLLALQFIPGAGRYAAALTLGYCLGVIGWMILFRGRDL